MYRHLLRLGSKCNGACRVSMYSAGVTAEGETDKVIPQKPRVVDERVVLNGLRALPDDAKPDFFKSGLVRRHDRKSDSVPANTFRKIIYDENEFVDSDLSQPPSYSNPHPVDPATLPPTHSASMASLVNHCQVLQKLVDVGVDLFQIDVETKLARKLIRMDFDRDIRPKLNWLVNELQFTEAELGSYLTRNPFFLIQEPAKLKERVEYLMEKEFNRNEIKKLVIAYRYWLNNSPVQIDTRLGWLQKQFKLSGRELRKAILKEPRLIAFGIGPLARVTMLLNREFGFNPGMIKSVLFHDPRLFMMDPVQISLSFNYLHQVVCLSNDQLAAFPVALRCPVAMLRRRFEFVKRSSAGQHDPDLPDFVPLRRVLHPSDRFFSEQVCRRPLADYYQFLKIE